MKIRTIIAIAALALCTSVQLAAQWTFTDATQLTIVGKLFPDTPNPYHRVDTGIYQGFDDTEYKQVHMSAGMAIAFITDSPAISVKPAVKEIYNGGITGPNAQKGFDLYIKKNGQWLWAGQTSIKENDNRGILYHNDGGRMFECLVYLPLFTELEAVQIGVREGCRIEALENPFRHRIAVFGSSFTHGYGCSRAGMCWTSQFSRMTGLQLLNLGCGGHSMLQDYFAAALAEADVEAYLFDGFSNPKADVIQERLFKFIEIIQARKPGVPLVFIKTLYREWRNFNDDVAAKEEAKIEMADRMMKEACRKYKDVYYVTSTNAADALHETTVDGVHPGDWGYRLYVESIKADVLKILAKYGIK